MNRIIASPLTAEQQELFTQLCSTLNDVQLAWISGYLAAQTAQAIQTATPVSASATATNATDAAKTLTVLYGSRTSNGESLAKKALQWGDEFGIKVTLKNMADYTPRTLQSEENLLVIVSTHGEGEPPFAAKELHEYVFGKRAPKLENLHYAVLALGDSGYLHFCKTGKDFDEQLEKLGGKRLVPIIKCDVDFEEPASAWLRKTLAAFGSGEAQPVEKSFRLALPKDEKESAKLRYTRTNPFSAPVFEKVFLHGRGSDRQTVHLELSVDASLKFEPGDAAGVLPVNAPGLVDEVLAITGLDASEKVTLGGREQTLREALTKELELSKLTPDVVERYRQLTGNDKLAELLEDTDKLQLYLDERDIVDLFADFPAKITATGFTEMLRKLQPRYYSIASSPLAYPDELHLTVGVVEYQQNGRNKRGTCSAYLSGIDTDNDHVPLFISSNPDFRLPADKGTPIIMVGAGTGIAPYRSFMQHREFIGNPGKSWLIFGNRNFETEFLYQLEWQRFLKSGALTKMDVAFSRDSDKKVYVQHKIAEHGAEIYRWLEDGAHFYLCGDRKKMAKDVQDTLTAVIAKEGSLSHDDATDYINRLQKEKRLQTDVY